MSASLLPWLAERCRAEEGAAGEAEEAAEEQGLARLLKMLKSCAASS